MKNRISNTIVITCFLILYCLITTKAQTTVCLNEMINESITISSSTLYRYHSIFVTGGQHSIHINNINESTNRLSINYDFIPLDEKIYTIIVRMRSRLSSSQVINFTVAQYNSLSNIILDKEIMAVNTEVEASQSITLKPGFYAKGATSTVHGYIDCNHQNVKFSSIDFIEDEFDNIDSIDNDITIYPNPIYTGKVNFNKIVTTYEVYNLSGNLITSGQNTDGFNIDGLEKGLYIIKINDNIFEKIIIQ